MNCTTVSSIEGLEPPVGHCWVVVGGRYSQGKSVTTGKYATGPMDPKGVEVTGLLNVP
jgi:hypothetical protein